MKVPGTRPLISENARVSLIECHASGELASWRTSRGFVSVVAWECRSPVARRDCEIVEMACLKINCSCDPDSSRTENLSKLRIRPVSFAPFNRYTMTEVFSRRTVLRKASWIFCGACLPSDMLKPGGWNCRPRGYHEITTAIFA